MPEGIFISYRRKGGSMLAGILYNELIRQFKQEHVFKDIQSLHPGDDFKNVINTAIEKSDIFLLLINYNWASHISGDADNQHLPEHDFAYFEIECALEKKVEIIPVLFENAFMPNPAELPVAIREITTKHAFSINSETVLEDVEKLVLYVRSKKKFMYEDGTLVGSTERIIKDPLNTLKKIYTDTVDMYKKDFSYLRGFFKKKK